MIKKQSYLPAINPQKEILKITNFIEKTFTSNNKTRALIAVSGGIDSATVLRLSAKALGPKNVFTLCLPTKTTNPIHLKHAQLAIQATKVLEENRVVIKIGGLIQKAWRIIKRSSNFHQQLVSQNTQKTLPKTEKQQFNYLNRLRLANLAARIRMLIIYDQAKLLNALVVGTENYSEHLLGYFTRFGDEASDLEPIKHLYKTQIYQLARSLKIPPIILTKEPTADLWPGQTDAQQLGFTYAQADPILYLHQQTKTEKEIIKLGYQEKLVKKVLNQVKQNHFKHLVPYAI